MFKHVPLVMAALLGLAVSLVAAEDYCLCDGVYPSIVQASVVFRGATPVSAPATLQKCAVACENEPTGQCDIAGFDKSTANTDSSCSFFSVDFQRNGDVTNDQRAAYSAKGSCESLGIDTTTVPGNACFDYNTNLAPTTVARKRQLNSARRRRAAFEAGIF